MHEQVLMFGPEIELVVVLTQEPHERTPAIDQGCLAVATKLAVYLEAFRDSEPEPPSAVPHVGKNAHSAARYHERAVLSAASVHGKPDRLCDLVGHPRRGLEVVDCLGSRGDLTLIRLAAVNLEHDRVELGIVTGDEP